MSKQKIEKQKMATITEVYNRIIWDTNLNRNMFIAGFHERISDTIREKPLAQWDDNSDIPWHRVRYIRCNETIVWDRENRIDLISTNNLPEIAWKSEVAGSNRSDLAALVANNQAEFQPRDIYTYDRDGWKVFTGAVKSVALDNTLTIVSYNILSNLHDADKIHTDKRLPVILSELAKTNADVIALQEVTPESLVFILATDLVKDYFISEAPNGNNVKPYGNLIMSRWAFDLVEYQFSGHKRVLVGNWNINDRAVHLANVHLTSDRGDNALQKRTQQLATVIGYLQKQAGDRFIVGDFNTRGNQQDEIINYGNFIDVWQKLYPDRDGYTFDPTANSLAMLMSLEGKPARLDRILWCPDLESNYQPLAMDLFGCKSFVRDEVQLYPSDHFCVCGVFKISPATTAPSSHDRIDLTAIAPVYESILAIIPPEDLFPPIQTIRQQYDAGFFNIVPHITLLYGFVPDRYFEEVVDLIAPILAKIEPFTVTLADFEIFTHHKSSTAYLRPIVKPEGALHELQAALYRLFPQCYEQSTKTSVGYNPHLSVGQFADRSEAMAKLPQWHPIKFTVDAVSLLSRTRNKPCVVKHIVGVGKLLPKVVENSELIESITTIEPVLTDAQQSQRDTVLAVVKQACTECLGFAASLHLLGSARLGVATPTSDLDVVCLIPDYLTGESFLTRVADCLQGLCDRSQVVLDAKYPVLRLEIEGISLDLLYTQVAVSDGWETRNIRDLRSQIKDTKSIIGCWEADLIIDLVKQQLRLERFQMLLKAVRSWAKIRGLYGNSWGFLGGFSWSLLCAYTCINYRDADKSLVALLNNFFQILSQHNWRQPIALTEHGKQHQVKLPQDLLPIISSIEPCKNTARNITRSTAKILRDEFARAAEISTNILAGKDTWRSLYESIDLTIGTNAVLSIEISDADEQCRQKCSDLLESTIIGLTIQLEQLDIFVRPNPQINSSESKSILMLFLQLPSGCETQIIAKLVKDFISQLNGVNNTTKLDLSIDRPQL
ncbi:poly(A) polymerase [Chamaesiphon polymorphus]|uniref:Poly(A) polymerase n=1 Tax=Chamaesiphon polymorphus CCALA 037 TaxID=2107692 RepID=A0A2T1GJG3_9CYAN|nr:poly(A) polymerase [Chamaesiphon polymorphus]PSB57949.1 poly(A) polymerase [Chamaesiphon polymorphus CCALA 037]